jgi:hypothetical protein
MLWNLAGRPTLPSHAFERARSPPAPQLLELSYRFRNMEPLLDGWMIVWGLPHLSLLYFRASGYPRIRCTEGHLLFPH